jgi:hypothetical protein
MNHLRVITPPAAEERPGHDRRAFLKTAAASAMVLVPGSASAQAPAGTPAPSTALPIGSADLTTTPGGLSLERLGHMHEVMAGYVDCGEVPGLPAASAGTAAMAPRPTSTRRRG